MVPLTQLAVLAHVGGGAVAFEVSVQVSAGAAVLAGLCGAVVHICGETRRQSATMWSHDMLKRRGLTPSQAEVSGSHADRDQQLRGNRKLISALSPRAVPLAATGCRPERTLRKSGLREGA